MNEHIYIQVASMSSSRSGFRSFLILLQPCVRVCARDYEPIIQERHTVSE